jgi:hypothetical protein
MRAAQLRIIALVLAAILFQCNAKRVGGFRGSFRGSSSIKSSGSSVKSPSFKFGSSFGHSGLKPNTYIYNNNYVKSSSGGSSRFLTNSMFYLAGTHHGRMWGVRARYDSSRRENWDESDDQKWRATTKAPYFENKIPGEDSKVLPASAVVGEY